MLIILVAIAVVLSILGELVYGYLEDRYDASWVRPELNEHAAIVRQLGGIRQGPRT
jgi:hypothetical protein